MKIIISSKQAEKLATKLSNHLKSLELQPITIDFDFPNDSEVDIKIVSAEGNMNFNSYLERIVPHKKE